MTAKRLRSRRQRAFALILLTTACTLAWLLVALVLLRSVQPASHLPL